MKKEIKKVAKISADPLADKLSELRKIIPEAFAENKIDWDKLKATLDGDVNTDVEKYGLHWAGKSNAFKAIRVPATGTLVPQEKESKDWDTTGNIFIEGDNLEVLKLLQKHYRGQIKMCYIDPPYNTGKDFIYKDNFTENISDYYERTGQSKDGIKLTSNMESNGRYHSDWLTMMYPRLFLAKNLLKDDGVIFVSIDDNEVANLRMIMDEIFGEENFVAIFPWKKRTAKSDVPFGVSQDYEWIVCYNKESFIGGLSHERKYYSSDDYKNDRWRLSDLTTQKIESDRPNSAFDLVDPKTGKKYPYNPKRLWGITKDTFQDYYDKGKIVFPDDYDFLNINIPAYRVFESEDKAKAVQKYGSEDIIKAVSTFLPKEVGMSEDGNKEVADLFGSKIFSYPKPVSLIKHFIGAINDRECLLLDFFAGSGTTAHAVMELNKEDGGNRKWICVQIPEETDKKSEAYQAGYKTIAEISRERIRRAGEKIKEDVIQEKVPPRRGLQEVYGYKDREIGELESDATRDLDIGFKSLKLSQSNYRQWNVLTDKEDEKKLKDQMKLFAEKPLVDGYDEKVVVYEILTKEGFDLNAEVEEKAVGKMELWVISGSEKKMFISFAKKLTKEQIEELKLTESDIFVCFDSALDDTTKVNLMRSFNLKVI